MKYSTLKKIFTYTTLIVFIIFGVLILGLPLLSIIFYMPEWSLYGILAVFIIFVLGFNCGSARDEDFLEGKEKRVRLPKWAFRRKKVE